ncbi:MAG: GldG family protein [Anaerolineae bacterium]|nr:GldG family protein [Anaerolineae bacterium]
MRKERDNVLTRGDIGQLLSFIGAFGILFAVVALLWEGQMNTFAWFGVGVGALGLGGWLILAPRDFLDFFTGRRIRQSTLAVFSTVIFIGIVVLIYIYVERSVITLDMTQSATYTLSPTTKRVLDDLNREIRITAFYSPSNIALRELDDQFFRQYEVESGGKVTRSYIDPIAQPGVATLFNAEDGDVFISYVLDDGTVDFNTAMIVPMGEKQERDMTSAINRLLNTGNFTVLYNIGFGERSPNDVSTNGMSLSGQLLRFEGYNTEIVDLQNDLVANNVQIPDSVDVIILSRPIERVSGEVIALLDDYLKRGGGLLILGDVAGGEERVLSEDDPFNQYLWTNWGIRFDDAVAVDYTVSGDTPLDVVSFQIFDSPISADIDPSADINSRTQFRVARPIVISENPPVNNGRVIMTSPDSYAETDIAQVLLSNAYQYDEGVDRLGAMTLVGWAADGEDGGRVILIGDSDFATDGQIATPAGNGILLVNAVRWLVGYEDNVTFGFESTATGLPAIFVDVNTQLNQIALFTLFIMPGGLMLIGGFIYFRRSRR